VSKKGESPVRGERETSENNSRTGRIRTEKTRPRLSLPLRRAARKEELETAGRGTEAGLVFPPPCSKKGVRERWVAKKLKRD